MLFLLAFASLDHTAWGTLLMRYVNAEHRVDYKRWKEADIPALDAYLAALAAPWPALNRDEETAALMNAYNALTIRWVLHHYPVASIWKTKKPFREPRHMLNGAKLSLDDIETRLRKMGDARIHAALVCAARSCPPLRREAYTGARVREQLADNTRAWLSNPRLNSFDERSGRAEISMIFKWYAADFPDLKRFLNEYSRWSPTRIAHKSYRWGLNDSGPLGENYSAAAFYVDALKNR